MPIWIGSMNKALLQPKYWATWLAVGGLWLIAHLPFSWQMRLGQGLGKVAYRFAKSRRHIASTNIRLCFPDLSQHAQEQLVKQVFIEQFIGFIETTIAWFRPQDYLLDKTEFHNFAPTQAKLAAQKPIMILGGHYAMLDLAGTLACNHMNLAISYRPLDNPVLNYVMERARNRIYSACLTRKETRKFIRTIKQGYPLWYLQDQDLGRENSVFVDFFGIPTATINATSRIAAISKAEVIPVSFFRRQDYSGYDIYFLDPLPIPSGDEYKDAQLANAVLEAQIRRRPEQYLWLHKRFKTRPNEQDKSLY